MLKKLGWLIVLVALLVIGPAMFTSYARYATFMGVLMGITYLMYTIITVVRVHRAVPMPGRVILPNRQHHTNKEGHMPKYIIGLLIIMGVAVCMHAQPAHAVTTCPVGYQLWVSDTYPDGVCYPYTSLNPDPYGTGTTVPTPTTTVPPTTTTTVPAPTTTVRDRTCEPNGPCNMEFHTMGDTPVPPVVVEQGPITTVTNEENAPPVVKKQAPARTTPKRKAVPTTTTTVVEWDPRINQLDNFSAIIWPVFS